MSTPRAMMGAVGKDEEDPSPSLSLLQRLKRLREWQERQRQELLQTQAYANTPTGRYLPPVEEETTADFNSMSTSTVPQRVEDHDTTPAGHPGIGPSSPVVPSNLQGSATDNDFAASPPTAVPQGCHTPAGLPGAGQSPLVVSVASGPLVKPPVSFPEEVNARLQDARERAHTQDSFGTTGTLHAVVSARESEKEVPHQDDAEECHGRNEENVMEGESEYEAFHTGETHDSLQSASLSPHEDPNECMGHVEDTSDGEERVPYRSEKYKSPAPRKENLRVQKPNLVKNQVPSRPFFSALMQGSEGVPEGLEETVKPRRRFLKKGEGTARFKMRPMRLRRPEVETEEECGWQGSEDAPVMPSPARTPARSQFRLPVQSLQLDAESPVSRYLQGTCDPAMTPTYPARPSAPTHQPSQPTFHPSSCLNTHSQPPASTLQSSQGTVTHPNTHNPAKPPRNPYQDLEKQQRKEEVELSAFEKLEELAEDSSFSSNSSTVWGLLKQGQQSVSSTPLRTPPPFTLQETPVVGSLNAKPKNLESHFLGSLVNRVLPPASQHQQPAHVDVKAVLAQLKNIVRLEGHSISDITESDIQSFLDASHYQSPDAPPHPTSTPVSPQPPVPHHARPHHVHFASEGVQVLEYQLSDTDGEETLTDATSLDSDMITTSDLEALTHLNMNGVMPGASRQAVQSCREANGSDDTSSSGDATLTEEEPPRQKSPPVVLHFSPPPPRPQQSASNYIWSIFGKERDARKLPAPKPAPKKTTKASTQQPPVRPQEAVKRSASNLPQTSRKGDDNEEELEVVKTLLLAKVAELEKETKLFKRDNAKLQKLQQEVTEEKKKLEEEKQRLHKEATTERKKFQEHVDRERNALWNERQRVLYQPPAPVTQPDEERHLMEMMQLREQVREVTKEAERKESLNQFTAKKLNDRIKTLENENRKLKERNDSLEKENQDLRLKVDRAKAGGRIRAVTQPTRPSQTSKGTRGRLKPGTRPTSVDGVAKALDRLTEPKPVVIKEPQTKIKTQAIPNDIKIGPATDEAVLKHGSIAEPPPPPHTTEEAAPHSTSGLKHDQSPLSSIPEESGLEHTERVREDGVQEVIYANGNRKEIQPNGDVMVSFYNGDRKEVKADRTVYVYGSDETSHTTYSDGREELVFPSGQREMRYSDGSSEISFADGSRKSVMSDGTEICTTKDGSIVRTNPDGSKVFEFPSGQREVHRGGEKRREYPNGTVKIVHSDGRTETRYNSGRIRIRDREGNVVLDTHVNLPSPPPSLPLLPHPS